MPPAPLMLAVMLFSACSPAPEPTRTPTPAFASEEEAFTAAKETYAAYMEAGNARIAGASSPNPQDFLIGAALEADVDGVRFLREQGLHLTGTGALAAFTGVEVDQAGGHASVIAIACLDTTGVRVIDAAGSDVTPPDRKEVVAQLVEFVGEGGKLQITAESDAEDDEC